MNSRNTKLEEAQLFTVIEEGVFKELKKYYRAHYLKPIEVQLAAEVDEMLSIIAEVESFTGLLEPEKGDDGQSAVHKSRIQALISDVWQKPDNKPFAECYAELRSATMVVFDQLEDRHIIEQKRERFYGDSRDSSAIKVLKWSKRMLFRLSTLRARLSNTFKKDKREINYWKHTIPFKNLAKSHLGAGVILQLKDVSDVFFLALCKQYQRLRLWEESAWKGDESEQISANDIRTRVTTFQKETLKEIRKSLNTILSSSLKRFQTDYEKAGTLELPSGILSNQAILQYEEQTDEQWATHHFNWRNTIFALFEQWRSDLDIFILSHKTKAELTSFKSGQIKKLVDQIDPEIQEIQAFIQDALDSLEAEHDSLQKELKRINYKAGSKLDRELVPRLCDKLSGQNVSNLIAKLESAIRNNVSELSSEHVIVKDAAYDRPLEPDELKKISANELISFETLGFFQSRMNDIKKTLFGSLEGITTYSQDLDHIVTFSLSSAIDLIEEEGGTDEQAITIAKEGLLRAKNRLQEAKEDLRSSAEQTSMEVEKEVEAFCKKILELTVNENVGELRMRITKAKATRRAEELQQEVKANIAERKRQLLTTFQRIHATIQKAVKAFENRFSISSSNQVLDREASDFLMESQEAIRNLPLIYRRLYEIEPLDDLELFEGRAAECERLVEAFENWKKGRYAAVAIVGEKWGGQTSFINFALEPSKYPYKVTRFSPQANIFSEDGLIEMMRAIFENDSLADLDQIVNLLNEGPKQIVILEDLQNLYLRKIDGFSAIQLLFQLITRTSQNVFWVTSTTIYTWKYLSKAVNMQEFFSYIIEMGDLSQEQIRDIIWKRNRISGFNILFESDHKEGDKKFSKLDEVAQQELLKKEFFASLNNFAKSNVSLALIFWLLSTRKVDASTITIGALSQPNLSFLALMTMEKVYVLHALLLHDGLNENQLSEVLNISRSSSRLNLLVLLEDGIVIKEGESFLINPIVFRNIVSMLKAKNLIH